MEFTDSDRRLNATAVFEGPHASTGNGETGTNAVVVAGVPIHIYVKDGTIRISAHCDWEPVAEVLDDDGNVRLEITVNGETVFSDS
jgi:hypothetical protein